MSQPVISQPNSKVSPVSYLTTMTIPIKTNKLKSPKLESSKTKNLNSSKTLKTISWLNNKPPASN